MVRCGWASPTPASAPSSPRQGRQLDISKGMSQGAGGGTCRCSACLRPISDRWMLGVGEAVFHERCLLCCVCRLPLHRSCYARHGDFYCRNDYDRLFGRKCLGCGDQVPADELVMRVSSQGHGQGAGSQEAVFHVRCFVCVVCGGRLQKGDQFVVKQGQLFCRADYEKEVEMLQAYTQGEMQCGEESVGGGCRGGDGRRGPKRPRTILTTQQRRAFKASFELSPKPCRKVREGLAKDTGLSVRIVQVWFQNQRAKMKKIQKKQRLDPKNSGKDLDGGDEKADKLKMKDEDTSPSSGPGGFVNDSCSDTEGPHGLEGSLHGESNYKSHDDTFYKDIMETDSVGPRQFLHSGENFIGVQGFCGNGNENITNTSLNPIDRLYSMQNSYFCGEEQLLDQ